MSINLLLFLGVISSDILTLTYARKARRTKIKICDASYQCRSKKISSDEIQCSGYGGCDSATINSQGTKGYIDCTAMYGCYEAKSIIAVKNVYCKGYESCYAANIISGKSIQCSGSLSCSHCGNATSEKGVFCSGYGACQSCPITAGNDVYCDGLKSCSATNVTSDNIYCTGSRACGEGTILSAINNIECSGNIACERSYIIKAAKVTFNGYGSGTRTIIMGTSKISADGYNALEAARLDSTNTTSMKVRLSNSTGVGTLILCQSGSECDVECTDSCSDTKIVQYIGSNLTVISGGNLCIINGTTIDNPECPMIRLGAISSEYSVHVIDKYYNNNNDLNYDIDDETIIHEMYAYGVQSDLICDTSKECAGQILINSNARCYGSESCYGSVINETDARKLHLTECYGESACQDAFLYNNNNILCNAAYGCAYSRYLNGKDVQCGGYQSCAFGNQLISASIYCEGSDSCMNNNYMDTKHNIKCIASNACSNTDLSAGNDILCDGAYSCSSSNLTSVGAIKCTATQSCSLSMIDAQKYVYVYGDNGAKRSTIYAPMISGYGFKSLSGSTIDSNNLGKLTVELYGNLAGYGASIICRDGDICEIKCLFIGCKDTLLICLPRSRCKVSPRECLKATHPKKVNGIYCPIITDQLAQNNILISKQKGDEYISKTNHNNDLLLYVLSGFVFIGIILYFACYYYCIKNEQSKIHYQSLK